MTALLAAIHALPDASRAATRLRLVGGAGQLTGQSLFTLGRGPAWAISNEAALKFKETCLIHAESYSSAEVLHGPVSIVGQGFPVIALRRRRCRRGKRCVEIADQIAAKGARVFVTSDRVSARHPPAPCPHRASADRSDRR